MSADLAAEPDSPTVRLTIPAKAEYITLVRLALSGLSGLRPLSDVGKATMARLSGAKARI